MPPKIPAEQVNEPEELASEETTEMKNLVCLPEGSEAQVGDTITFKGEGVVTEMDGKKYVEVSTVDGKSTDMEEKEEVEEEEVEPQVEGEEQNTPEAIQKELEAMQRMNK